MTDWPRQERTVQLRELEAADLFVFKRHPFILFHTWIGLCKEEVTIPSG